MEAFGHFVAMHRSAYSEDEATDTERKTRECDGQHWHNTEFVTAFDDLAVSQSLHKKASVSVQYSGPSESHTIHASESQWISNIVGSTSTRS